MIAEGVPESFRLQAAASEALDSPFYAELSRRIADDIEAGGVFAGILDGWQGRPTPDALPLRLLGAIHRAVLAGEEEALGAFYPTVGGLPRWPAAWEELRRVAGRRAAELRVALGRQVQTNEVRRSAVMLGGFLLVARERMLPLRLLEVGCSAGLNLRWDRYRYELLDGAGEAAPAAGGPVIARWGAPAAEPVLRTAWRGDAGIVAAAPAVIHVASRAGCDLAPLDVREHGDARTLEGFVWGDQPARLAQLRLAIGAARRDPVRLVRSPAADWLAAELARPATGVATVVFHSVMWWYLGADERGRVAALVEQAGGRATARAPLAWLRFDLLGGAGYEVRLRCWPGGEERCLGRGDPHGRWVAWGDPGRS